MAVITLEQARAQGLTAKSIMRCAFWNADRAKFPMSDDTAADETRHRQQAIALHKVARALEKDEEKAFAA